MTERNVSTAGKREWDQEVQDRMERVVNELSDFYQPISSNLQWIRMLANQYKTLERKHYAALQRIQELEGMIHNEGQHG